MRVTFRLPAKAVTCLRGPLREPVEGIDILVPTSRHVHITGSVHAARLTSEIEVPQLLLV